MEVKVVDTRSRALARRSERLVMAEKKQWELARRSEGRILEVMDLAIEDQELGHPHLAH